ncbi:hypothetical protein HYU15_00910 [Candidatus Woesearchaeota archaeon]|nr:hypothetical protein [Candidatus Woesearchaeota archaeon]
MSGGAVPDLSLDMKVHALLMKGKELTGATPSVITPDDAVMFGQVTLAGVTEALSLVYDGVKVTITAVTPDGNVLVTAPNGLKVSYKLADLGYELRDGAYVPEYVTPADSCLHH